MRRFLTIFLPLVVAAACILAAWAAPRPAGDLYTALAGGRDVLDGKLGQPDDWAFTTGGRVWVNRSWGSDALLYLAHEASGDAGFLVLKAILLLGIVSAVAGAARVRHVTAPAALLAAGAALLVLPAGMALRPNLVSLLLLPLLIFLLYRSRRRSGWLWAAVVLVALWANLHAWFVAGLAILGLWAVAHAVVWAVPRWRQHAGPPWMSLIALGLSVALTGFANPWGLRNLTAPLMGSRGPEWRPETEWMPTFSSEQPLPWALLIMAAALVLLCALRLLTNRMRRSAESSDTASEPRVIVFEILLALGALAVALPARAFLPLVAVMLAPILAVQLHWMLAPAKRLLPTLLVSGLLLAAVVATHGRLLQYYDPDNPRRPPETLFQRMTATATDFPDAATRFLNDNNISGHAFNEQRWEGFIRWRSPQVMVYVGDREPDLYEQATLEERDALLRDPNPTVRLRRMNVHLVIVPLVLEYAGLCQRLLVGPDAGWAYIYCDRRATVLADAGIPETRRWIEQAATGQLRYPDDATAYLSRGMCLASTIVEAPPEGVVANLEEANRLRPTDFSYPVWQARAESAGFSERDIIAYLETESARLEQMDVAAPNGLEILKARERVAKLLVPLYAPAEVAKRKKATELRTAAAARIKALQKPY